MASLYELVEDYCKGLKPKSAQQIDISCRYLGEFLAQNGLTISDLDTVKICDYLQFLRNRKGIKDAVGRDHVSNATLRRILYSGRAVCRQAGISNESWDRALSLVPLSKQPEKRSAGRLTGEELKRLIIGLPDNRVGRVLTAFLSLAFGGALRRGEILKLRLGDIYRVNKALVCRLAGTKNGQTYQQVISPQFADKIEQFIAFRRAEGAKDSEFLICSSRSSSYGPDSFNKLLKHYSNKILGRRITTHWGRYSAITKLLEDGFTYREVQNFSRHASVSMVEVYDKRMFNIESSAGNFLTF